MVTADVSREEDAARAAEETLAFYGRIDILFNNAGINIRKQPQDLPLEEWQHVLNVNLTSAFLMSKAVYPAMKRGGGGKIINIGSMTSIFGAGVCRRLCVNQGRDRPVDQEPGAGLGGRQHSGQRDPAGLVRYRADREGPGAGPGPSRARPRADRGRAAGPSRPTWREPRSGWRAGPATMSPELPFPLTVATRRRSEEYSIRTGRRLRIRNNAAVDLDLEPLVEGKLDRQRTDRQQELKADRGARHEQARQEDSR